MLRREFGPIRGNPDRAAALGWGNREAGVTGDGVPRGIPNAAQLARVHVARYCQFAYSRYTSV
jgi:hypothetical protein